MELTSELGLTHFSKKIGTWQNLVVMCSYVPAGQIPVLVLTNTKIQWQWQLSDSYTSTCTNTIPYYITVIGSPPGNKNIRVFWFKRPGSDWSNSRNQLLANFVWAINERYVQILWLVEIKFSEFFANSTKAKIKLQCSLLWVLLVGIP